MSKILLTLLFLALSTSTLYTPTFWKELGKDVTDGIFE
jgi:hypothetical protein